MVRVRPRRRVPIVVHRPVVGVVVVVVSGGGGGTVQPARPPQAAAGVVVVGEGGGGGPAVAEGGAAVPPRGGGGRGGGVRVERAVVGRLHGDGAAPEAVVVRRGVSYVEAGGAAVVLLVPVMKSAISIRKLASSSSHRMQNNSNT